MPLDYTQLKVDQTLLQSNERLLLVSNVNIPESEFGQLDAVLTRLQHFVSVDYQHLDSIYYQINATYDLRNSATGEIRHWSGSFNPRGNRLNILCDFQPYVYGTFKEQVTRACDPQNIYNKLRFFHAQTAWVFDKLTSAIVSVQAYINPVHSTIERRQLLANHGRRSRVHLAFHLP